MCFIVYINQSSTVTRVVFVWGGGSRGTSPLLDLTFPPTGLSENLGGMERGGEGKGKGKGGETTCLTSHPLASASNTTLVHTELLFSVRLISSWILANDYPRQRAMTLSRPVCLHVAGCVR